MTQLWTEKTEYDTLPDPDAEVAEGEEPKTKTVPRTTNVWETINTAKPLWMRNPKEVPRTPTHSRSGPRFGSGWDPERIWMPPPHPFPHPASLPTSVQPSQVSEDEYEEFYKTTFRAYDKPEAYEHFSLEGQVRWDLESDGG